MKINKLKSVGLSLLLIGSFSLFNAEDAEASKVFLDVNNNSSHSESINYLNNLNIFDYKTGYTFKENESITRSESAKILYNLFNSQLEPVRSYNNNFKDIQKTNPFYKEIVWSYEVGIFDGDSTGTFKGNSNLTRGQMAKILVNSFDLKSQGNFSLKDVKKDNWVYDYVSILYGNKITVGDGNGNYLPNNNVSNGQFSSFVYRTLKVVESSFPTEITKPSLDVLDTFTSEYDFKWNMVNKNLFLSLEGVKDGKVVAKYETGFNKDVYELSGVLIGTSNRDAVRKLYGNPVSGIIKGKYQYNFTNKEYDIYLIKNNYITVFYDIHKNNVVRSILVVDKDSELNKEGFYGSKSDLISSQDSSERLMIELINQARSAEDLPILNSSQSYREIARLHSSDMIKNNYFSHYSPDGLSPYDRMLKGGFNNIPLNNWGENLAYGQFNSIYAHEALMNSAGHRANILNSGFTNAFVGMSYKDTAPYWTIGFYSLKK